MDVLTLPPARQAARQRAAHLPVDALRGVSAQEAASIAIEAAAAILDANLDQPSYFHELSRSVAGLVGARRAAFWRLSSDGTLAVQPEPHGFTRAARIREARIDLVPGGQGVAEGVVFRDLLDLHDGTCAQLDDLWRAHGLRSIRNSIAVSWPAGDRRLGALAAYDSSTGFTADDVSLLRVAAAAAGMAWRHGEARHELEVTAQRLKEARAVRLQLLSNVASGGDAARRRLATALHDDTLQLLTAAELQLERIRGYEPAGNHSIALDNLGSALKRVEDSLRRLLVILSPGPIDLPVDLEEAIRDRLETFHAQTGIEPDLDLRIPGQLPGEVASLVFKNVAEALTNVEKHAHASQVRVLAHALDGGVRVEVTDDGTGFVVDECMDTPGHLGLLAMKERALLAGGWCRLESEPGAGARVAFWVPVYEPQEA